MRMSDGVSREEGIKRRWGCRRGQFSSLSLAICSETLDKIYIQNIQPWATFQWFPSVWPWVTLNSCFTLSPGYPDCEIIRVLLTAGRAWGIASHSQYTSRDVPESAAWVRNKGYIITVNTFQRTTPVVSARPSVSYQCICAVSRDLLCLAYCNVYKCVRPQILTSVASTLYRSYRPG